MKDQTPFSPILRLLPAAVVLLILIGCDSNHLVQNDPFLGPQFGARGTNAAASASGVASAPREGIPPVVPPLPGRSSVSSQAALASGTTPAPQDTRPMRMDVPAMPVSSPGGAARGVAPGNVQMEAPVPIADGRSPAPIAQGGGIQQTGATSAAPIPPAPANGNATFEQVQQALKQRGVVWQRLEGDQGQWKFQCSMPIPGQKNVNRTYETQAPLPNDPLSAMRSVLKKIDEEQQR